MTEKAATAEVEIAASTDAIYDLVADVQRMGEWSPECRRCEWLGGADRASVGARFRGHNRFGIFRWSRVCEVLTATRGKEFAFRTVPRGLFRSSTIWRFELDADGPLSRVRQSYVVSRHSRPIDLFDRLTGHTEAVERGMRRTLRRIKEAAEAVA